MAKDLFSQQAIANVNPYVGARELCLLASLSLISISVESLIFVYFKRKKHMFMLNCNLFMVGSIMQTINQSKATSKSSIEIRDLDYQEEVSKQDEFSLYGGRWVYACDEVWPGTTVCCRTWVY
jgi:hypothetical protein